jgi:hypothetical protein
MSDGRPIALRRSVMARPAAWRLLMAAGAVLALWVVIAWAVTLP